MKAVQVAESAEAAPAAPPSSSCVPPVSQCPPPPSPVVVAAQAASTTTPSREGRSKRFKARKRHANFAVQETNLLLAEIRRYRHILFNVISPTITPHRKVAVWEEISARLAARGWNRRAGKELRRKWENLRYETKIKFMKQIRGEQYHLKWTPLNAEVLQLMREDATYSLPSAIEEWKSLPHSTVGSTPPSTITPTATPNTTRDDEDVEGVGEEGEEEGDEDEVTRSCEAIAAAAQVMENYISGKNEPNIAIKSEGPVASTTIATSHSHPTGGDPCHLMSHFSGLEPDMLHPALRSIELGGGMEDEDEDNTVSEEHPTTANSHHHHHHHHRTAMESLEHQLHTSLPSFNSLHLPDPVQRPQPSPSNLEVMPHHTPISRFVQTSTAAAAAAAVSAAAASAAAASSDNHSAEPSAAAAAEEAALRIGVLRMKEEAYRAKRDYYLAKMRTLCEQIRPPPLPPPPPHLDGRR